MESAKTFEDFKEILKNYEIETYSKFNVYNSPKGFLDEKCEISADMKLHWNDGLPYFHFGTRNYTCHQGKDKNLGKKQKYMQKKQEKAKTDHIFQKTYHLTQTTKKLDCPASIKVTRVYTIPQFKLENPTKVKKMEVSAKIKNKLRNNEDVETEEVFWFTLPSADVHKNHLQGEISANIEPVDPVVRLKTKELFCCDEELFDNNCSFDPDPANRDNGCNNHNVIPEDNSENTQGLVVYGELEKKGSNRRKLINECNSHIRNLSSVLWLLDENALLELKKDLLDLAERMQNRVNYDNSTGLPLEIIEKNCKSMPKNKSNKASKVATDNSIQKQYGKLKGCAKRKLKGRVGMRANAIRKSCKKIVIKNETEKGNVLIEGCFDIVTDSILPVFYESTTEEFHFNDKNNCIIKTNKNIDKTTDDMRNNLTEDAANGINSCIGNVIENQNGKKKKIYIYSGAVLKIRSALKEGRGSKLALRGVTGGVV